MLRDVALRSRSSSPLLYTGLAVARPSRKRRLVMDAQSHELPSRRRLAHPAPLQLVNRPTIVLVTVCVKGRRPLLASDEAHALLTEEWRRADRWLVGRYVVMPDHVHLFCAPADRETPLRQWVEYWRWSVTRGW